ncbi:Tip attachment protein J [uncultured Caudovirales phage]|uniref:Tip attachment protein J n=1 Tax=uncultured Caudovirales phage TaxID=2100421 RepID=A0A6J5KPG0_9CAUD|nr:Tip attachment protein J [uncultured Caudovirales phage]CAB4123761.1 Tip attachment protein J [uncultured Caudovirales phage]
MAELLLPGSETPIMTVPHAFSDMADAATPVIVHPHPFTTYSHPLVMSEGMTVSQIVEASGIPEIYHQHVQVWIDDEEISREVWHRVRPRSGRYVYVKVIPGKNGKSILGSILMLVVMIAAIYFAPMIAEALTFVPGTTAFTVAKSVIGAALTMIGGLLVSSLVKPPGLPTGNDQGLVSQRALLTGVQNRFAPYSDVPRIYGKRRVYPLQGARPYTEAVGNNRYVRVLLCVGWGPLKISDIKIGETPITAFENIEYQVREGWTDSNFGTLPTGTSADTPQTLFTNSVHEENFSVLLTAPSTSGATTTGGDWELRTTTTNTNEISVDINFPQGLATYDNNGNKADRTIEVEVQWSATGANSWQSVVWSGNDEADGTQTNGKIIAKDKSSTAVARGGHWTVPSPGQYDVRLRRKTAAGGLRDIDRVEWSTLRSIRPENPLNINGLALISFRMKATDQFNGMPDSINCIVESYLPVYNGSSWAYQISRNPAWAYADVMRRRGTERMLADSRMDLDAIRAWAAACDATAPNASEPRWAFDGIFESGSLFTAMRQVASHGRASFVIRDGKYSIVRDVQQTVPVQHITPRNSFGYSGSRAFVDLPHALKAQFVNAAKGYQDDELIVYADGYGSFNATKFETIQYPGITSASAVWREARYHLAVGYLRPDEHQITMDVEALRCTLGDLVLLAHDVISIGLGSGRVTDRAVNGSGMVTAITLDQTVAYFTGRSYVVRVRLSDGTSALYSLAAATENANTDTVSFAAPISASSAPAVGDLFIFGESTRDSAKMLVKKIEPGPDLTARVTLVDAQDGVYTADTGSIPAFVSNISDDTAVAQQMPPDPNFTLASDETVIERLSDGTLQDRIGVAIGVMPSGKVDVAGFDIQFRESGTQAWRSGGTATIDVRKAFLQPVVAGTAYDIRVRSVSRAGVTSNWVYVTDYVVIGKTTPPGNVSGFGAAGRVDGVFLFWTPNTEIDVVGYEIRVGPTFDTATVVADKAAGPTYFAAVTSPDPQVFYIRAVDAIGLTSLNAASVSASVSVPDDLAAFDVYPQEDNIRANWTPVPGTGVEYEIRNGDSWSLARKVARSAGSTVTVKWPIREFGSPVFWIKAVSNLGVFSENAFFATVAQAPLPNRNIVLDVSFADDSWSGQLHDIFVSGTGPSSFIEMAKAPDGRSYQTGDYFRQINLPASYYARNWIEMSLAVVSDSALTWNGANFTWDDAGNALTWVGELGDLSLTEVSVWISAFGATLPSDLVEGFRFNGSSIGVRGTSPSSISGFSFSPCRFSDGLKANSSSTTVGIWPVATPETYSVAFDVRFVSLPTASVNLCTLSNSGGSVAACAYRPSDQKFVFSKSAGVEAAVQFSIEVGDVVTVVLTCSSDGHTIHVFSRRYPTRLSAAYTGAGWPTTTSFSELIVSGQGSVIGDLEIRSKAFTNAEVNGFTAGRAPVGYGEWRELLPGDFQYQDALVWTHVKMLDRTKQAVITDAHLTVDLPDVVEPGTASVSGQSTWIAFTRTFNAPPTIVLMQKTGSTTAIAQVVGTPTKLGFYARLVDVTNPANVVAGSITYTASGY